MLTLNVLYASKEIMWPCVNFKPKVDTQPEKSVTPVNKITSNTDSATSNCNCGYVNS